MNTIYLTSLLLLIKIYLSFQEIWTFFHVSWLNLILIVLSQECLEYLAFWPLGYSSKLLPWDLLNHCSFKGPSKSATTIENLIVLSNAYIPVEVKPVSEPRFSRFSLVMLSHAYLPVLQIIILKFSPDANWELIGSICYIQIILISNFNIGIKVFLASPLQFFIGTKLFCYYFQFLGPEQ